MMNLEARKITFIREFLEIQNEEIIVGLENLLKKSRASKQGKMTFEKLNSEIDLAMDDSKNGRMKKAESLIEKFEKWG